MTAFSDDEIIAEINGNRLPQAMAKIAFRQMKAWEEMADAAKPVYVLPPQSLKQERNAEVHAKHGKHD